MDATTESNNGNDNSNTKNEKETLKLQIKLNLNNVAKGVQKLKLVAYVNGEAKEQYHRSIEREKPNQGIIYFSLNLNYDKSNDDIFDYNHRSIFCMCLCTKR